MSIGETAVGEVSKRLDRRTRLKIQVAFDWKQNERPGDLRLFVLVENESLHPVQLQRVAMEGAYRGEPGWVDASNVVIPPRLTERFDMGEAERYGAVDRDTYERYKVEGQSFGVIYNGAGGSPLFLKAPVAFVWTAAGKRYQSIPGALIYCHDGSWPDDNFPVRRGHQQWMSRPALAWIVNRQWNDPLWVQRGPRGFKPESGVGFIRASNHSGGER